jgi:hypothetical protein
LEYLLAYGVGVPLVPIGGFGGLLGGQDLDKTGVKRIEVVGLGDVAVERMRVKLGKHVNAIDAGVDTIADGNVNQPIFSGNWDSRFRAEFIQWEKA